MTKKTFTFIHVNKCGGRSINHALTELFNKKNSTIKNRPEGARSAQYSESHGLVNTPITPKTPGNLILIDCVFHWVRQKYIGPKTHLTLWIQLVLMVKQTFLKKG